MTSAATSMGARLRATETTSAIPTRPTPNVMARIALRSITRNLFDDPLGLQEIAGDILGLHFFAVDLVIHLRHVRLGKLRADVVQDVGDLRVRLERILSPRTRFSPFRTRLCDRSSVRP